VFEPTGWGFLGVLVIGFAGLLYWLVKTRRIVLRVAAGVLAFALSTLFGAAMVNDNYQYYTTWGALAADLSNHGTVSYTAAMAASNKSSAHHDRHDDAGDLPAAPSVPPSPTPTATPATTTLVDIPRLDIAAKPTTGSGRVVRLDLPGKRSGIDRRAFVYLPPQYFQPAYANIQFPVLELLHGDPGQASGWIYGLSLAKALDHQIDTGQIGPMVVVMPSTFSGAHGQDCVDAPRGPLDDSYLTSDVAADMVADFRVLPPGPHWGIGGLSDGGFCAANLALRHLGSYGAVASMDGFYSPQADLAVLGKLFNRDAAALRANDPTALAQSASGPLPRFWIMRGTKNNTDTAAAGYFEQVISTREKIMNVVVEGGTHTPPAWRAALPSLSSWMWNTLSGGPVGCGHTDLPLGKQPAPPSAGPAHKV
jgi:enterochelin esterase-like enzyme